MKRYIYTVTFLVSGIVPLSIRIESETSRPEDETAPEDVRGQFALAMHLLGYGPDQVDLLGVSFDGESDTASQQVH